MLYTVHVAPHRVGCGNLGHGAYQSDPRRVGGGRGEIFHEPPGPGGRHHRQPQPMPVGGRAGGNGGCDNRCGCGYDARCHGVLMVHGEDGRGLNNLPVGRGGYELLGGNLVQEEVVVIPAGVRHYRGRGGRGWLRVEDGHATLVRGMIMEGVGGMLGGVLHLRP